MRNTLLIGLSFSVSALLSVGALNAQDNLGSCYAQEVIAFNQGLKTNNQPVSADRSIPERALGQPDASNAPGGFVSLGVLGSITLGFGGPVMDQPGIDLLLYETSYSGDVCGFGDDEYAHIELSADGVNFVSAGIVCRDGEFDMADYGLDYVTQIRITSTETTTTPDGYDVDGVVAVHGCTPIPATEGCFGSNVISYNPGPKSNGQPITDAKRLDPTKALGEPQLNDTYNFVSLGYGGSIVIEFDGYAVQNGPGDDIRIAETSFGSPSYTSYPESAEIFVSQNGVDFYSIGVSFTNGNSGFDISDAGQGFDYIIAVKVVDTTPAGSVSEDGYDLDGIVVLNGCSDIPEDAICEGVWRTQTQGGWGSPANGNNPGVYRNAHFDSAFPNGLVIGCEAGYTLTLTSASAVQAFLPSGGGPQVFNQDYVDPTGNKGSFTGNLTALALSVGFDNANADFAPGSDFNLKDLVVQSGNFSGWSVEAILAEANLVIGGCSNNFTPQQMNSIVDNINNAYVDGNNSNNGLLGCPSTIVPTLVATESTVFMTVNPNPSNGNLNITISSAEETHAVVQIFDMSGREVATLFNQAANAGQEYRIDYSNLLLPNGIYISKLVTSTEMITEKIMIAK